MILLLRNFQFNALSCGNKRPNLSYKKALQDIFEGFSPHQSPPENRHVSNNAFIFYKYYSETAVTTHLQLINQEAIYTSSCVAVDLNFNS